MLSAADIAAQDRRSVKVGGGYLVSCPAEGHRDAEPSCKVTDGPNGVVFHCFAGCDWRDVRAGAERLGWIEAFEPRKPVTMTARLKRRQRERRQERDRQGVEDLARRQAYALSIWGKTGDPAETPVVTYVRSRGIDVPALGDLPPSIRYGHVKEPSTGAYLPAMVAAVCVWPDIAPVGVHVTFLTPKGRKAPVSVQKRGYGLLKRGAVRLAAYGKDLAVAEGIESALSFMQIANHPTWATLSTSGLRAVRIPHDVERVLIAADHDGPGLAAARDLAQRIEFAGKRCRIMKPPTQGHDWNDALHGATEMQHVG